MKPMLKSYEAIYEKGSVRWLGKAPILTDGERIIVVVDEMAVGKRSEAARKVLDEAWGAWGLGQTLAEIDRAVTTMREDWERLPEAGP